MISEQIEPSADKILQLIHYAAAVEGVERIASSTLCQMVATIKRWSTARGQG
jgi:hypothetical protein